MHTIYHGPEKSESLAILNVEHVLTGKTNSDKRNNNFAVKKSRRSPTINRLLGVVRSIGASLQSRPLTRCKPYNCTGPAI